VTGNRQVSAYAYDPQTSTMVCLARHLTNPTGDARGLSTFGKAGLGDFAVDHFLWVQRRPVRDWSARQSYPSNESLIGRGEAAVQVRSSRFAADGKVTGTWRTTGNLCWSRIFVGEDERPGAPPRTFRLEIDDGARVRNVVLAPRPSPLTSEQWLDVASDAVFDRPEAFAADMPVTLPDKRVVKLTDIAAVSITTTGPAPTYWLCEVRPGVSTKAVGLPSLTVRPATGIDWREELQVLLGWEATATAAPAGDAAGTVLYMRLPDVAGVTYDGYSPTFIVTSLTVDDHLIRLHATFRPALVTPPPHLGPPQPPAGLLRPLVAVSLGQLTPGAYRVEAIIDSPVAGATMPPCSCAFEVR
jgi:hypothetical protein